MLRKLLPGNVTVSIRATAAGLPTGADLCVSTVQGNNISASAPEWVQFPMTPAISLTNAVVYAIVVRVYGGDQSYNYVSWYSDVLAVGAGHLVYSSDNGATWIGEYGGGEYEMWFEVWDDTANVTMATATSTSKALPLTVRYGIKIDLPTATSTSMANVFGINSIVTLPTATTTSAALVFDAVRVLYHQIKQKPNYNSEPMEPNYVYVIGIDDDGNKVFGTASDAADIALVDRKYWFLPDTMITSTDDAESIADIALAGLRLSENRGDMSVHRCNIGAEQFDMVSITDTTGNQSAVKYRISGWTLTYDRTQAVPIYEHKFYLCGA